MGEVPQNVMPDNSDCASLSNITGPNQDVTAVKKCLGEHMWRPDHNAVKEQEFLLKQIFQM